MQLIPAEFHGTPLSIIDRAGLKWLTAEQVGRCLGYVDANARKGISKLYSAHADEFTDADTCVVDLATQAQSRAMRIFSGTGCIKLGFFANTPRAKAFRAWASQVLAAQSAPVPASRASESLALAKELGALRDELRAQNGMILALYGQLDGARRGHLRALTSLAHTQKRQSAQEAKELVLMLEAAGVPRAEIARRSGRTLNHIRQIVHRAGRQPAQGTLDLGGAQ